jgi:23S rRNA pseudouridine1911/1915/1917 synthase
VIEISIPPEPPSAVEPEAIALNVLLEDEFLVAINKPAGMGAHPAPGCRTGTLVAALLHRWKDARGWPDPQRPGIVHRLDRDTTGVIVVAKTPEAMHNVARQFARRTVEKTYLALVHGAPRRREGTIDLPIGRDPVSRQRMQARVGQKRAARTRFEVVEIFGGAKPFAALLRLHPETGRTHQIRVHLASLGHPVVGDRLYGGDRVRREVPRSLRTQLEAFPRHALHAASLTLRHPQDGRSITVAAELPADMTTLLEALRDNESAAETGKNY